MFVFLLLVSVIILLIILLYFNGKHNENYWKKRGAVFWKKNRIFGVLWTYLCGHRPLFEIFEDMYKGYSEAPAIAFGTGLTPSIFVKDVTNIHHVTISDFESFSDRGLTYREEDVLANNISLVHGPKWKLLRQALSPLFTTVKLKNMHYIIDKCARDFIHFLKTNPDKQKEGAYDTMNTFCCAALTAAVFGCSTGSTFDSPFIDIIRRALAATTWSNLKFCVSGISPRLFKLLGMTMFPIPKKIFVNTISQVIKERKTENSTKKHDFIELAVKLQKNGSLIDTDTGYELKLTDEVLASQASFFYMAGLEPSASGLFATLLEIARNPEIQNQVQQEIDEAFEQNGGELTYDTLKDMKYLDKVIKEALRMYPPVSFLTRVCVKDTVLPVGNIKIEKGTKVYLPIYSLHHDGNYFSTPNVFDPQRFSTKVDINGVYIPFGEGNRICLGQRYAHILIMTGVAHVLRHFTVNSVMKGGNVQFRKEFMFLRFNNCDVKMSPRYF